MKLADLAAEPKLIPVTLDSELIVEKYGEPLEFWILDRQPIDKYLQMARTSEDNMDQMVVAVNEMILNEEGNPIVSEGKMLPSTVLMEAFTKVIEALGK
tara:strand:- start:4586 stop:4882 length:297 start_codon:yes stop_codon:yes gene_type:complete